VTALGSAVRAVLDRLYLAGGIIAACFLIAILIIIVLQMLARWTGHVFPGSTDYAGYCMAAASFFAFAHALSRGAHIRVNLLLTKLGRFRRWGEIWCFTIGSALACYFAYYAIRAVYWSRKLHDISQGQDATPVWIPQLAMAVGTVLLAIALIDNLVRLVLVGKHGIEAETVEQSHGE
jgi:TRAP-type C4-dicarboxylate transport system permease small subunit